MCTRTILEEIVLMAIYASVVLHHILSNTSSLKELQTNQLLPIAFSEQDQGCGNSVITMQVSRRRVRPEHDQHIAGTVANTISVFSQLLHWRFRKKKKRRVKIPTDLTSDDPCRRKSCTTSLCIDTKNIQKHSGQFYSFVLCSQPQ